MTAEQRESWGRRIGFGANPALVIVDFSRAFTESNRPLGSDVSSEIVATNRLLDAAHRAALPIIFTVIAYTEPNFEDAGMWLAKVGGQDDLRAGSDGVAIDPRLDCRPGDSILAKKYASGFFGTDLASRLQVGRVDTILLAGCSTSGCVRATAVDAIQSGFRPMVVKEAVADRWNQAHEQALRDLDAKYADVVALDEAVRYLGQER